MTTPPYVDPSLRHGDVGERWGNFVAPAGAFAVGHLFRFQGEEGEPRVVKRVLVFPTDRAKRLFHYETAGR